MVFWLSTTGAPAAVVASSLSSVTNRLLFSAVSAPDPHQAEPVDTVQDDVSSAVIAANYQGPSAARKETVPVRVTLARTECEMRQLLIIGLLAGVGFAIGCGDESDDRPGPLPGDSGGDSSGGDVVRRRREEGARVDRARQEREEVAEAVRPARGSPKLPRVALRRRATTSPAMSTRREFRGPTPWSS